LADSQFDGVTFGLEPCGQEALFPFLPQEREQVCSRLRRRLGARRWAVTPLGWSTLDQIPQHCGHGPGDDKAEGGHTASGSLSHFAGWAGQ
jgi:hypothetical protein